MSKLNRVMVSVPQGLVGAVVWSWGRITPCVDICMFLSSPQIGIKVSHRDHLNCVTETLWSLYFSSVSMYETDEKQTGQIIRLATPSIEDLSTVVCQQLSCLSYCLQATFLDVHDIVLTHEIFSAMLGIFEEAWKLFSSPRELTPGPRENSSLGLASTKPQTSPESVSSIRDNSENALSKEWLYNFWEISLDKNGYRLWDITLVAFTLESLLILFKFMVCHDISWIVSSPRHIFGPVKLDHIFIKDNWTHGCPQTRFKKVNVCGVYDLLSSHFPLAHHWGADISNFLLKRKENNSFYPLCNSFITGWAFSSGWIYFYWSGALMVVQSQIPAMTENMPSHVFEYIEASLTLCTPRLDAFSSAHSTFCFLQKRADGSTSLCTRLPLGVYLFFWDNNSHLHKWSIDSGENKDNCV